MDRLTKTCSSLNGGIVAIHKILALQCLTDYQDSLWQSNRKVVLVEHAKCALALSPTTNHAKTFQSQGLSLFSATKPSISPIRSSAFSMPSGNSKESFIDLLDFCAGCLATRQTPMAVYHCIVYSVYCYILSESRHAPSEIWLLHRALTTCLS